MTPTATAKRTPTRTEPGTGYQFTPYIAVEIAYIDGGTPDDTVGGINFELETTAFQAAGFSEDIDGTDFAYGVGAIGW